MTTKTAFLGTPGFIPAPDRFGKADLFKAVGANTGNLIFQYAATSLVGGNVEHVGFSGKPYGDSSVFRGLTHFVFPAANHLRVDGDWALLTRYLATIRVPLIVLGLGAQAEKGASPEATAARLRANASVVDLVALLKERARLITVRGRFSEAVCHELGLTDVIRLGCPSQFISPDRKLGATVANHLKSLKEGRVASPIGLTASAPNELEGWRKRLEEKLFEWTVHSGGLYVQQSCEEWLFDGPEGRLAEIGGWELSYVRKHIAPSMAVADFLPALHKAFRLYFDARRWIAALEGMDLTIGTRIHGNMAALAASRPGILVVHDARVTELGDEMHVPRVDGEAVVEARTYADLVRAVEFDGDAFDIARREKAARLKEEFDRVGLTASDHLKHLAAE